MERDLRQWMRLVEALCTRAREAHGNVLLEAAGTYGFFRPADKKEIRCDGHYNKEHADYVLDDPAAYGLTSDEVSAATDAAGAPDDKYSTPKMQQMTRILALVMRKGWVRVNYYRSAWSFQAFDLLTVRKAVIYYANIRDMQEANIDWGPDPAHCDGTTLYPADMIERFIKTGRIN